MSHECSSPSFSVRDLLKFRSDLELGYGLFEEITGLDLAELNRYRRQRGGAKPNVSPEAAQRIARCQQAFQFALEITAGDDDKAVDWLYAPSPIFDGKSPIDLAPKKTGFAKIENVITQMRSLAGAGGMADAREKAKVEAPPENPPTPSAVATPREVLSAPVLIPSASMLAPSSGATVSASYTPKGLARAKPSAPTVPVKVPEPVFQKAASSAAPVQPMPCEHPPASVDSTTGNKISDGSPKIQVPRDRHLRSSSERVTIEASHSVRETWKKIVVYPVQEKCPDNIGLLPAYPGIELDARLFRIKTRLQPLLEKEQMSIKELGTKLLERGLVQFKSETLASRISNSYTWATWREVLENRRYSPCEPA